IDTSVAQPRLRALLEQGNRLEALNPALFSSQSYQRIAGLNSQFIEQSRQQRLFLIASHRGQLDIKQTTAPAGIFLSDDATGASQGGFFRTEVLTAQDLLGMVRNDRD